MSASPGVARPSLYFDPADLADLRHHATTSHRRYVDALTAWVDAHLDRQPLRGIDVAFERRSSEVYFEETFSYLSNVMLAYLVTQDARYADTARAWLRVLCTYPTEMGGSYAIGPYIAALAQGYDWLADIMPDDERAAIRAHLTDLVRWGYDNSYSPDRAWWYGCHLHHDFWIPTAGYGIGALVLRDEVPEAREWLRRAAEEIGHIFDVLANDGAWLEGAADWVYGLVLVLLFSDGYRRVGGESFYDRPWLRNTWQYRLYSWLPDDSYVYLNDSFRSGRYNILGSASCHVVRRLAGEYRNGYMQWLADRDERFDAAAEHPGVYRSPYTWLENRPYASSMMHALAWNVLWFDPSVESRPPDDLPIAHHFENQGIVIARSGWGPDASVVTFSCGPIGGHEARRRIIDGETRLARGATHAHAQANSFTLFARGSYRVVPPGYGRTASRFQNTVAINGGGQIWDPRKAGELRAVELTPDRAYALGDASACYPEDIGIRRYVRHLLFLPPDFLVLCDLIEGGAFPTNMGRNYAWHVHGDPAETRITVERTRLAFDPVDGGPCVDARVLVPEIFGWFEGQYRSIDGTPLLQEVAAVLNFQVPNPAAFVTVFGLTDRGMATAVTRLVGDNCVGAVLGDAADPLVVAAVRGGANEPVRYRVEPARSARHLVIGLTPGQAYDVSAALADRNYPWPESALRIAEEDYVNVVTIRPGTERGASAAGVLAFPA